MTTVAELVEAWAKLDAELTAPGAPFEVVDEDVRGERMAVFADRPRSLREILTRSTGHGDRAAVVIGDGTELSFVDLEREVAAVAAGLAVRGVRQGDRVAIASANNLGWLLSFWAATSLGAVVTAMNGWWTQLEVDHALGLTEPSLVLADAKRLPLYAGAGIPTVDIEEDLDSLAGPREAPLPDAAIAEDDPAMLIFTSGTTGRPKAAVLSHRSLVAFVQLQSFIAARGMAQRGLAPTGPPPTALAVAPLFHVSGISGTIGGLLTGTTTVWPLGRFDAARVIELTKRHGIGAWRGTVTHIMRLLDDPAIEALDVEQIKQVGIGGSASSPLIIRRTEERFPHLKGTFASGYGSTETGGLSTYASNAMLTAAPECVGPALPTVAVRTVDADGNDVPEGEDGDVVIRSPLLMTEYWRHPEGNAEVFLPGGWVRTGDVGRIEDGALFLASRKRDLIIRGGENVYPFEIENRLEEHPDVMESAVIPREHPVLGQEVKAVVVLAEGSSLAADELRAWCAQSLASYKVPAHLELRTEPLPRNASGKIVKHGLRS